MWTRKRRPMLEADLLDTLCPPCDGGDDDQPLPEEPSELDSEPVEPSDGSDFEYEDMPCTDDGDDSRWDAFIPDEDEWDPQPDPGDFWIEPNQESRVESEIRCGESREPDSCLSTS